MSFWASWLLVGLVSTILSIILSIFNNLLHKMDLLEGFQTKHLFENTIAFIVLFVCGYITVFFVMFSFIGYNKSKKEIYAKRLDK